METKSIRVIAICPSKKIVKYITVVKKSKKKSKKENGKNKKRQEYVQRWWSIYESTLSFQKCKTKQKLSRAQPSGGCGKRATSEECADGDVAWWRRWLLIQPNFSKKKKRKNWGFKKTHATEIVLFEGCHFLFAIFFFICLFLFPFFLIYHLSPPPNHPFPVCEILGFVASLQFRGYIFLFLFHFTLFFLRTCLNEVDFALWKSGLMKQFSISKKNILVRGLLYFVR